MKKSRNTSRFEYKYILSTQQYYALKNALKPFLEQDPFTKIANDNRYFVSSIYYDTFDLKAFHERNDGQFGRIKLRIRTYSETAAEDSFISVELKTKKGNAMIKYSTLIPLKYYFYLIDNNCWPVDNDDVLNEFFKVNKGSVITTSNNCKLLPRRICS